MYTVNKSPSKEKFTAVKFEIFITTVQFYSLYLYIVIAYKSSSCKSSSSTLGSCSSYKKVGCDWLNGICSIFVRFTAGGKLKQ